MIKALLLLLFAAPATSAHAEGAGMVFTCQELTSCGPDGACTATPAAAVTFTLAPLTVGPEGEGIYKISYGNAEAEAQAMTGIGPFMWRFGTREHTLLFSSETNMLWHALDLDTGRAEVFFLACEVSR